MSPKLKLVLKVVGVLLLILVVAGLYKPAVYMDEKTGYVQWRWSGWRALFNSDTFGVRKDYYREVDYDGVDGPYIMNEGGNLFSYRVTKEHKLIKERISRLDSLIVRVPNEQQDSFYVLLRDSLAVAPGVTQMPEKLLVLSDIEGNFNGMYSYLVSNDVIDQNYNWTYGAGHLVLLGDFVDRGEYMVQVLWLIYMLEDKAERAGGKVHYILGNHEVMNLQGNAKYAHEKYIKMAQNMSGVVRWDKAYKSLFGQNTELGNWLRTKNAVEKIGDYVFVHAGFSEKVLRYRPDIDKINTVIRDNIDEENVDSLAVHLMGSDGPLWYRGMAIDYKNEPKMDKADFKSVLAFLNADKIVIGHTVVDDIMTDYSGSLIKVDVHHGHEKYTGKTKGLLIENGVEYKVDDKGQKEML